MKVKELIEILQGQEPEFEIELSVDTTGPFGSVGPVRSVSPQFSHNRMAWVVVIDGGET